jgi:hypothetical protein
MGGNRHSYFSAGGSKFVQFDVPCYVIYRTACYSQLQTLLSHWTDLIEFCNGSCQLR